jgi:excinuclease ABC subunit A
MAITKKSKNIEVRGARTHNLQNLDLDIPINKITCLYGPSGSGKSSLAFHTILAESKRRYMNSLPNDVKFFWNMPTAADVDSIEPVLPVWGLSQHNPILGSRPTLADSIGLSELVQRFFYDYAYLSCPEHKVALEPVDSREVIRGYLKDKGLLGDESVFHFYLDHHLYKEKFSDDSFPNRSYCFDNEEAQSFEPEDLYWEIFRLKEKGLGTLLKRIDELKLPTEKVLFSVKGKKGLYNLPLEGGRCCPKCDYLTKYEVKGPAELSPYNATGACDICNGHGMNLEYDRKKVAKHQHLTIPEGAVSILESSHFSHLYTAFEKEAKKLKISMTKPFAELPQEKVWKLLNEGAGDFPGLKACYHYLDSKRYKRTVRIFSRKLKSEVLCPSCEGVRVSRNVHALLIDNSRNKVIFKEIWKMTADELSGYFSHFKSSKLENFNHRKSVILELLETARSLGLGNIPLWKKAKTLSSSEYQRSLLTKILSYEGSGSLFVLDEPSFDLSIEEQTAVFACLKKIKDQGNTVLLVEHSEYLRSQADYCIEVGPGSGPLGGQLLKAKANKSKKYKLPLFEKKNIRSKTSIEVKSLSSAEYDYMDFYFKKNETTVVWGNSSSKKDYYFQKVLANTFHQHCYEEPFDDLDCVMLEKVKGELNFENFYNFNSSVGKANSRSTVGTTIGLSPELRKYYAGLPVSKEFGLEKGHFSPNSELGRCTTCEGKGVKEIEMSFLEDITLVCDDCEGKQLKPFLANISDGQFTAHEALNKPMSEIVPKLKLTPKFQKLWSLVELLNLGYLSLSRPISTLSGGERLRIKLLSQLTTNIENSLLIFDNISSGLSSAEISKLFDFLDSLKFQNNTILIIDQNPVVINKSKNRFYFGA